MKCVMKSGKRREDHSSRLRSTPHPEQPPPFFCLPCFLFICFSLAFFFPVLFCPNSHISKLTFNQTSPQTCFLSHTHTYTHTPLLSTSLTCLWRENQALFLSLPSYWQEFNAIFLHPAFMLSRHTGKHHLAPMRVRVSSKLLNCSWYGSVREQWMAKSLFYSIVIWNPCIVTGQGRGRGRKEKEEALVGWCRKWDQRTET